MEEASLKTHLYLWTKCSFCFKYWWLKNASRSVAVELQHVALKTKIYFFKHHQMTPWESGLCRASSCVTLPAKKPWMRAAVTSTPTQECPAPAAPLRWRVPMMIPLMRLPAWPITPPTKETYVVVEVAAGIQKPASHWFSGHLMKTSERWLSIKERWREETSTTNIHKKKSDLIFQDGNWYFRTFKNSV